MTDNEIIKALECCQSHGGCKDCPYDGKCCSDEFSKNYLFTDVFNLIHRQKEEIERLKFSTKDIFLKATNYMNEISDNIKSEAIKEFAERLKEYELYMFYSFPNKRNLGSEGYIVLSDSIDNLVKEMTEVNENDRP